MRLSMLAALLVMTPLAAFAQQGGGYPFDVPAAQLVAPSPNGDSFNPQSAFEQSPEFVYRPAFGARFQGQAFKPGATAQDTGLQGGLSLQLPLFDSWSAQIDAGAAFNAGSQAYGGAVRAFSRWKDFSAGLTAAVATRPSGSTIAVGPEAQVYLGQFTVEGWGGVTVDPKNSNAVDGFGMLDLSFYPSDDWRVTVGGALVNGWTSARIGTEYSLAGLGMPLSVTGDARVSQDGAFRIGAGFTGYLGGAGDTVVGHDRYDFMPNRALDLASSLPPPPKPVVPGGPQCDPDEYWDGADCQPVDPEEPQCGPDEYWNGEGCSPNEPEEPQCPPGYVWTAGECTQIIECPEGQYPGGEGCWEFPPGTCPPGYEFDVEFGICRPELL